MRKRKVLVPLDGSAFSREVLGSVTDLLDPGSCELVLLRVAAEPEGTSATPLRPLVLDAWLMGPETRPEPHPVFESQYWESLRAELRTEMSTDVRRLRDAGFEVTAVVLFGHAAEEITDFVERREIDLVAMATHGRSGVGRLLMGSVAEKVLRRVPVPVMMLRPRPVRQPEPLTAEVSPA